MESIIKFFQIEILSFGDYKVRVYSIAAIILIILIARLVLWLINKALFGRHKAGKHDLGSTIALFQIIKYVVWIVAIGLIFDAVGIKFTVLLAGSAALLVGVGLGLQQTFNDIISGIILLSERTIKVGDILEIDGDMVKVQDIGLRTSKGLNRDNISIIIPNAQITNNKVVNWSHQSKQTRFKINVGVAYGSDLDLVVKVLKESAFAHAQVSNKSLIGVRLLDFSGSSLNFQVLFYTENIFEIEKIKSEIRFIINKKFIENHIAIPLPQMDVHLRPNEAPK